MTATYSNKTNIFFQVKYMIKMKDMFYNFIFITLISFPSSFVKQRFGSNF